jgi:hypothetical protein
VRNRRTVTEVSGFVKSHPLVLNGKYAAIIWREYVGSACPAQGRRLARPPRWPWRRLTQASLPMTLRPGEVPGLFVSKFVIIPETGGFSPIIATILDQGPTCSKSSGVCGPWLKPPHVLQQ